MDGIYIVGVGMTPCGKFLDRSVKDLTRDAVGAALADAGVDAGAIEAAFFSNATQAAIEGQLMIPGQIALRDMGIGGIPVANVENACASASTALHLAYAQLKAGLWEVALAVGAEKVYDRDKAKGFSVFNGAWDGHGVESVERALEGLGRGIAPPPGAEQPQAFRSVFMDVYAAM